MLDKGANPVIKNYRGSTQYDTWSLSGAKLNNLPTEKSIFFPIVYFTNNNLHDPWQYSNGIFPGKFNRLIGSGGEGHVVQGVWNNIDAAFKWVPIGKQELKTFTDDTLADMEMKLSEMKTMQATIGSSIMPLIGHFR